MTVDELPAANCISQASTMINDTPKTCECRSDTRIDAGIADLIGTLLNGRLNAVSTIGALNVSERPGPTITTAAGDPDSKPPLI